MEGFVAALPAGRTRSAARADSDLLKQLQQERLKTRRMEPQLAAALAKAEAAAAAQQLAMEEQMELVVADHADRASRLAELHQRDEGGDRAAERAVTSRSIRL